MQTGAITGYIDVAQLALYVFWGFFAVLVLWLHREGKREGYPLITDHSVNVEGFPAMPQPKTFLMQDGSVRYAPRDEAPEIPNGTPSASFPGAPLDPIGNPHAGKHGPRLLRPPPGQPRTHLRRQPRQDRSAARRGRFLPRLGRSRPAAAWPS